MKALMLFVALNSMPSYLFQMAWFIGFPLKINALIEGGEFNHLRIPIKVPSTENIIDIYKIMYTPRQLS